MLKRVQYFSYFGHRQEQLYIDVGTIPNVQSEPTEHFINIH